MHAVLYFRSCSLTRWETGMTCLQRCYILRLLFFQSDIYFSDIFLSPNPMEYYFAAVRQRENFQLTVFRWIVVIAIAYPNFMCINCVGISNIWWFKAEASFEVGWGHRPPPPPKEKEKKKKRKKKEKKRKKEKKEKKEKKREKRTMNNVKLLHIKCWFFHFFNSQMALKNKNNFWPPKKKLKWRPWFKAEIV